MPSRLFPNGGAGRIQWFGSPNLAYPFSAMVWWKPDVFEGTTVFGFGESAATPPTHYVAMGIDSSSRMFLEGAAGGDAVAGSGIPMNDSAWQCLIGVFVDATHWWPYLNGVVGSNNAPSYTPGATIDRVSGPGLWFDGSYGSHARGKGAHWTLWEGLELTAAEVALLAGGLHPWAMHRDKIALHWEGSGTDPEHDDSGQGRTGALTGTQSVVADTPPVAPFGGLVVGSEMVTMRARR